MGLQELLKRKIELENEMLELNKQIIMASNAAAQETFRPYMVKIAESGTLLAEVFAATHVENYEEAITAAVASINEACGKAVAYLSAWKLPQAPMIVDVPVDVVPQPMAVPPITEEMLQRVGEEAIIEAGIDPVHLLPCDERLKRIMLAAKDSHPRIATRLTEGFEKVVIDEDKKSICLGNLAFNGGERSWLIKSVKDVFGENFGLK